MMRNDVITSVLIFFVSVVVVVASTLPGYFIVTAHAEEFVQGEQFELPEPSASDTTEAIEFVQDEQIESENSLHGENESYLQNETYITSYSDDAIQEYLPPSDYEYEVFVTLKSIEYQLKIISGGVILAVISLFIWYTILKPIKQFTSI